jgi:hypothetical protein
MPAPSRRYISPHQLPSWNAGGVGGVPVLGEGGSLSPLLSTGIGALVGYFLGGWKGSLGSGLAILGANNLGLAATDKPVLRLSVAILGIGAGGYLVYTASKKQGTIPNPPKWLRRITDKG